MTDTDETGLRREWIGVLARAPLKMLENARQQLVLCPAYDFLRKPESGMVMIQGRVGGNGQTFNLGEMTLTRCTVKTENGYTGTAYVQGRSRRHAELAALFDALLQDEALRPALMRQVIAPAKAALAEAHGLESGRTAATKVEFFTMVRSE